MKLLAGIPAILVLASFGGAQDSPRFEIFGGYSFEHNSPCGTTPNNQIESQCGTEEGELVSSTTDYNGWNASATGYLYKFVGLTADFSGHYGTSLGSSLSRYGFLFGPVFAFHTPKVTPFAHVLFGGLSERAAGNSALTYTSYARALGGGLDVNLSKRFAVRVGQFDYEWISSPIPSVPSATGFRFSAGVVFKL
jgi:hypothetical protein